MDEMYVESPECVPSYHTLPISGQAEEEDANASHEEDVQVRAVSASPQAHLAQQEPTVLFTGIPRFKPPTYLAHISHSLPQQLQTVYLPPNAFIEDDDAGDDDRFDSTTIYSPLLRQELNNCSNRNRSSSLPIQAQTGNNNNNNSSSLNNNDEGSSEESDNDSSSETESVINRRKRDRLPSYKSGSNETVILNQSGQIVAVEPVPSRRGRILRQSRSGRPLLDRTSRSRSRALYGNSRSPTRSPVPNRCVYTQDGRHDLVDEFSLWGILAAVFCFPVGVVCCFACCRSERCVNCGMMSE